MFKKKSKRSNCLSKADQEFSLLMRAIEADEQGVVRCVTCGKRMTWKGTSNAHWGHYRSRGFNSTRFDPRNGGVQCIVCNSFREGEAVKMREYLVKRYGESEVQKIEALCYLRKPLSDFELGVFAASFRKERIQIVKKKGI